MQDAHRRARKQCEERESSSRGEPFPVDGKSGNQGRARECEQQFPVQAKVWPIAVRHRWRVVCAVHDRTFPETATVAVTGRFGSEG